MSGKNCDEFRFYLTGTNKLRFTNTGLDDQDGREQAPTEQPEYQYLHCLPEPQFSQVGQMTFAHVPERTTGEQPSVQGTHIFYNGHLSSLTVVPEGGTIFVYQGCWLYKHP